MCGLVTLAIMLTFAGLSTAIWYVFLPPLLSANATPGVHVLDHSAQPLARSRAPCGLLPVNRCPVSRECRPHLGVNRRDCQGCHRGRR